MSDKLKNDVRFADDLLPYEEILWQGRPTRWWSFRFADLLLIPLSLFLAMLLTAAIGQFVQQDTWGAVICLMPHFWFALYLLVGRFIHQLLYWRRWHYAVTNKRLLLRCGKQLHSVFLETLTTLNRRDENGGRGTLTFEKPLAAETAQQHQRRIVYDWQMQELGFYHIAEAKRVYLLIYEQREMSRQERSARR